MDGNLPPFILHMYNERASEERDGMQFKSVAYASHLICVLLTAEPGHNIERLKGYNE